MYSVSIVMLLQIGVFILTFIMMCLVATYIILVIPRKLGDKIQKNNKKDNYDDYIENSEKFENEEEDEDDPIKRL